MKVTSIRRAAVEDAEVLHAWRNHPETRIMMHSVGEIQLTEHVSWLSATLQRDDRELFIAEIDGRPVGTVRVDHHDTHCELSYTVDPEQRGKGIATDMIGQICDCIQKEVWLEIKRKNLGSIRVAEKCGFAHEYERDGVLHMKRAMKISV